MPRIDELRKSREDTRVAADEILTRAQAEESDLTPEESTEYQTRIAESREADDAIEEHLEEEVAEVRAQATREPKVETRTLGGEILKRGWDLKTNPSVTIAADDLVASRRLVPK